MVASVTASFTAAAAEAENFAFSIQRAAEQVGTSSEMFSKLAYNAKLAGVPVDTLKSAMERLSRSSGSAESGNNKIIAAYKALGISVQDLHGPLKDSGDLFVAVAKGADRYSESNQRTALLQQVLGRGGAELAPVLKQVALGFDTASTQAELFGVVIGDKSAAQARQLHMAMMELESVVLGFSLRLLSGVSPALQEVSTRMINIATSADGMKTIDSIASSIATSIRLAADAFQFLFDHGKAVTAILGGLGALRVAGTFAPMIAGALKAGTSLDLIGLSALRMVGSFVGVTQLGRVFGPMISSGIEFARITALVAVEDGIATAATQAFALSLNGLTAALQSTAVVAGGSIALLTAGLAAFGFALNDSLNKAKAASAGAATWADIWEASLDQVTDKVLTLKLAWDMMRGTLDAEDNKTAEMIGQYGLMGRTLDQVAAARARARDNGYVNYGNGEPIAGHHGPKKLDAPSIPKETTEKVDQLKLKMAELASAASVAQSALANSGKGVDFQRASEISAEYSKVLSEFAPKLDKLSASERISAQESIMVSIATKINDEAQAKYFYTLLKGNEQITAQADAHQLLTEAIGKSAAAVRQAQIDSELNTKHVGDSDTFSKSDQGRAALAAERIARSKELAAADAQGDKQSLDGVQDQIDAQMRLNGAIMGGEAARRAANQANEESAIRSSFRSRGDDDNGAAANAAVAANRQLIQLKEREADLDKAASMDPARVYREQTAELERVSQAATAAGASISNMTKSAADKANWDAYLESIDKTTLAVGDAGDGVRVFFNEMARNTESAAQQVKNVLGGAFESVNDSITKLTEITAKNTHEMMRAVSNDFANMFRSISGQLLKVGLQKAEQGAAASIMGAAGKGDPTKDSILGLITGNKSDPTVNALGQTNHLLEGILAVLTPGAAIGTAGGLASGIGKAVANDKSTQTMAGIIPVGISSLFPGFGGHRATGGDVMAGMTYDVGEMGEEMFTPTQNGRITPNNKMGSSPNIYIDAKGATDPAQTESAVHRAMGKYIPSLVSMALHAGIDTRSRTPSSLQS